MHAQNVEEFFVGEGLIIMVILTRLMGTVIPVFPDQNFYKIAKELIRLGRRWSGTAHPPGEF